MGYFWAQIHHFKSYERVDKSNDKGILRAVDIMQKMIINGSFFERLPIFLKEYLKVAHIYHLVHYLFF